MTVEEFIITVIVCFSISVDPRAKLFSLFGWSRYMVLWAIKPDFCGVQDLNKRNQIALTFIGGNQVRHVDQE